MEKAMAAAEALKNGRMIVIYDGDEREGEADIVFHASFATHEKIAKLRKEAGGLICVALGENEGKALSIPFYTDILRKIGMEEIACKRAPYGDEPAFSISINHRRTRTGITDEDRALTIRELEKCLHQKNPAEELARNFYSPGHVFLLISRGLKKRKGHTELATHLAGLKGMTEAVVLCEMLGEKKALAKRDAEEYAAREGMIFITGEEITR